MAPTSSWPTDIQVESRKVGTGHLPTVVTISAQCVLLSLDALGLTPMTFYERTGILGDGLTYFQVSAMKPAIESVCFVREDPAFTAAQT